MNKRVVLFVVLFVFALSGFLAAQDNAKPDMELLADKSPNADDPGIPDTVRVESSSIPFGTTQFTVPITLYNDENLGGFNLPITWDSPDIVCDSITFVGGRADYVMNKLFSIDNDNNRFQAGIIIFFEAPLGPGDGMIYTAHFSMLPGAVDQVITFDSTFYPPGGNFALTLESGFNILPQAKSGTVTYGNPQTDPTILLAPSSFDFSAVEGEANPLDQTLLITNIGAGSLNWTASSNAAWLTLDPTSGVGDGSVALSVDITGLSAGTYNANVTVSDPTATNDPQIVPVTLIVDAPPPTIVLNPTSFSYTITEGDALMDDQLSVSNSGGGILDWTAGNVSGWLTLSPTSGVGDGNITLSYDVAALTAGTYYDTITVSDINATNDPQIATVMLVVEEPAPTIVLDPTAFSYTITEGDALPDDQLSIANSGGGVLDWTASNLTGWLTLAPTSGLGDASVTMSFDVAGVPAGTYYDTITVSDPAASNNPQKAAVMLVVEPPPPTISLDPMVFNYAITAGDGLPDDQLTITNVGGSVLNWTAGNFDIWMTLDPTSGSGDGMVTLSFDVAGLGEGVYVDTIVVSDPAATNDPQFAYVNLTVSAIPIPVISVTPTEFEFFATEGGANPVSQTLSITNIGDGVLDWSVSESADWLTLDPLFGGGNGTVTVSVDMAGLMPGVHTTSITVTDPLASNSPVTVPVTFTIEALPVLAVAPTAFNYTITEGDAIPDDELMITNDGGGVLSWSVTNLTGWLMLDPASGSGDGMVTMMFDVALVPAGIYYDTITVTDPSALNSPQLVPVTVTINPPPPVIALDPMEINIFVYEDEAIPDFFIDVSNVGGGVLDWSAFNQTAWTMLDPTSGTGDGAITVSFDIMGVMPGVYYDTVFVNDPAASNTPQYTVITLTVYETDHVEVETVTAFVGQQVEVAVDYTNALATGQFTLPLSFVNTDVFCDSVSFEGTRMVAVDESVITIDNAAGTIEIFGFSIGGPILPAGSGTIARMFFTVAGDAAQQFVPIDTVFIAPDGSFEFTYFMGDPKPTTFTAGGIDISDTPCFEFPTDTVGFNFYLGDVVPSISLPVNNVCGGVLEWSVTGGADWLVLSPLSGNQYDSVVFSIDTTGMIPGSYVTTATFESNGVGTPFEATVVLNLMAIPIISLSPDMVDLGQVCRGDTVQGSFDIINVGHETLNWDAEAPAAVFLSDYSGTGTMTVSYYVVSAGLDLGHHSLEVTVTSDFALNSPQVLTMDIFVVDCNECTFDIAETDGAYGVPIGIPVYTNGINDVAGLQFNIAYDPTLVTPDSVTSSYMMNPTIGFAGNQIHYVWDDIVNPITVGQGEVVMTLWVTPIGGPGSVNCFEWAGVNEITDPYGIPYEGVIYCGGCLSSISEFSTLSGYIWYYNTPPVDSFPPPVPDVTVELSGDASDMTMTDADGKYMFFDVMNGDYTITPYRTDDDPGVSVGDAVKIERHLAFVEEFDNPYKMIAADVSLNDMVTIADVVLIRRYLAELEDLASGNWTFVDSDFAITMANWFDAPHMRQVMVADADVELLNFVGIRMGDVVEMEPGQGTTVEFTIPDLIASPSATIAVPVLVTNFSNIGGVEIHITFDMAQVEIDSITSLFLSNPTVNSVDGRAHIIWDDFENPLTLADGSTLALIHFRVMPNASGELYLEFMASCESTDEVGDPYSLLLNSGKLLIEPLDVDGDDNLLPKDFALSQNYPNPFNPTTTISYSVDKAMSLVFEVYNVSGQLVDRIDLGRKSAGSYILNYDGTSLASGIYTYRLAGDGVSVARQMMLVK